MLEARLISNASFTCEVKEAKNPYYVAYCWSTDVATGFAYRVIEQEANDDFLSPLGISELTNFIQDTAKCSCVILNIIPLHPNGLRGGGSHEKDCIL